MCIRFTRVVAQVQDVAVHAQAFALQNGSRQVAAGLAAEVVQPQVAHQRAPGATQLHLLCPTALCQPDVSDAGPCPSDPEPLLGAWGAGMQLA